MQDTAAEDWRAGKGYLRAEKKKGKDVTEWYYDSEDPE